MRPAKFFFALILGVTFLITFLKVLFFGLMFAAVFGTIYMIFRAGAYMAAHRGYHPQHPMQMARYAHTPWSGAAFQPVQSIDQQYPNMAPRYQAQAPARHIEVL